MKDVLLRNQYHRMYRVWMWRIPCSRLLHLAAFVYHVSYLLECPVLGLSCRCPTTQVKLTSRDPSPPPVEYVRGGGGIFKDMAVHDLDMSRFLMGSEPKVRRRGIHEFMKRSVPLAAVPEGENPRG